MREWATSSEKIRRQMPRSSIDTSSLNWIYTLRIVKWIKIAIHVWSFKMRALHGLLALMSTQYITRRATKIPILILCFSMLCSGQQKKGAIILTDTFAMSIPLVRSLWTTSNLWDRLHSHRETINWLVKHQQRII